MGGNLPGGNFTGENFPVTAFNMELQFHAFNNMSELFPAGNYMFKVSIVNFEQVNADWVNNTCFLVTCVLLITCF